MGNGSRTTASSHTNYTKRRFDGYGFFIDHEKYLPSVRAGELPCSIKALMRKCRNYKCSGRQQWLATG
jgi:hypothetical protein